MMRHFFLLLSGRRGLRRWMETSSVSKKLTRRFIAGETLNEELAVCGRLKTQGIFSTLDHLGENVTSIEEAAASRDAYIVALDEIAKRALPSTVSVKLSQFGLNLSQAACFENVRQLAARAKAIGSRVEIDMESSAYTDATLEIASRVAAEYDCVRCVLQAYLHRTEADLDRLNELRIPVRLCKGAYDEATSVAFPGKRDVDRNYVALMKKLFDRGAYPAIATHDERIVREALKHAAERRIDAAKFEFQMLYGIRRDLQREIVAKGYRMRVYVPYGTAWYPYFMRRLAERPANALFLLRNLFH